MIDLKTAGTRSIPGLGSGQSGSYGKHGNEDQGTNCATIDICPDLLFGGLFAAGAAAFAALYIAITMAAMKRKRREAKDNFAINDNYSQFSLIQDIVFAGMFKTNFEFYFKYMVNFRSCILYAIFSRQRQFCLTFVLATQTFHAALHAYALNHIVVYSRYFQYHFNAVKPLRVGLENC